METSMEVGRSRFASMEIPCKLVEVDLLPWKLVEAFMEIHGKFHCRWKWKLPLLPRVLLTPRCFDKISIRVHRLSRRPLPVFGFIYGGYKRGTVSIPRPLSGGSKLNNST